MRHKVHTPAYASLQQLPPKPFSTCARFSISANGERCSDSNTSALWRCLGSVRIALARLDADYLDQDAGGYFQVAAGARDVLVRAKNAQDGPTPAGNGLLLGVLARLHLMTGERRWLEGAGACARPLRARSHAIPARTQRC